MRSVSFVWFTQLSDKLLSDSAYGYFKKNSRIRKKYKALADSINQEQQKCWRTDSHFVLSESFWSSTDFWYLCHRIRFQIFRKIMSKTTRVDNQMAKWWWNCEYGIPNADRFTFGNHHPLSSLFIQKLRLQRWTSFRQSVIPILLKITVIHFSSPQVLFQKYHIQRFGIRYLYLIMEPGRLARSYRN